MLTRERILALIGGIHYKDWNLVLHEKGAAWSDHDVGKTGPMFFVQVQFYAEDKTVPFVNRKPELQKCRWWLIDTDKGDSEVVRTAYKAIEAAVLHELQEEFRFLGKVVMDPHRDLTSV